MTIKDALLKTTVGSRWTRIGIKHHHGIDVSLMSLHSNQSCGIGEFYDLIPLIDWCKKIGLDIIQLLPINDTGDDVSPFFPISSLAINPLFLSLHQLPGIKKEKLQQLRHFTTYTRVAFHEVQSHKSILLHEYFEKEGQDILKEKKFKEFEKTNEWLQTYALFKVLKNVTEKNHWQTWPVELRNLQPNYKEDLLEEYAVEIDYHIFLQYLCFEQLTAIRSYANKKGIFLKGDIPLLVSPDSADVWEHADQFDLTLVAGSPPDRFTKEGQIWGLPLFHWEIMKETGYEWWRKRLTYAENFYDIYRIDHVIGFYRIWAILPGRPCNEGKFIPEEEALWLDHGREILRNIVNFTSMFPIAEDLGIVPDSVRISLSELGICGIKVMRWETYKNTKEAYIDFSHYNPISMTTVSTHDSATLTLWWYEEVEEAKKYAAFKGWEYSPHLAPAHRKEILRDSHHTSSFFHINLLGEYLALFPELVWENPHDERINVPGTVTPTNWTYKIRPSIETILAHEPLAEEIKKFLL